MTEKTVSYGNFSVVVQSVTRRTALLEAQYKQWLYTKFPEAKEIKVWIRPRAPEPPNPTTAGEMDNAKYAEALALYRKEFDLFWGNFQTARNEKPLAYERNDSIVEFVTLAKRIPSFDEESLLAAYDSYLSEAEDGTGFWAMVRQTIIEIDTPVPVEDGVKLPPELRPADEDRPLRTNGDSGSANLSTGSNALPSSEKATA